MRQIIIQTRVFFFNIVLLFTWDVGQAIELLSVKYTL